MIVGQSQDGDRWNIELLFVEKLCKIGGKDKRLFQLIEKFPGHFICLLLPSYSKYVKVGYGMVLSRLSRSL